jgi:hypothetical protein
MGMITVSDAMKQGLLTDSEAHADGLHRAALYLNDHKGQDWIQYVVCNNWAHKDRVDPETEQFACLLSGSNLK